MASQGSKRRTTIADRISRFRSAPPKARGEREKSPAKFWWQDIGRMMGAEEAERSPDRRRQQENLSPPDVSKSSVGIHSPLKMQHDAAARRRAVLADAKAEQLQNTLQTEGQNSQQMDGRVGQHLHPSRTSSSQPLDYQFSSGHRDHNREQSPQHIVDDRDLLQRLAVVRPKLHAALTSLHPDGSLPEPARKKALAVLNQSIPAVEDDSDFYSDKVQPSTKERTTLSNMLLEEHDYHYRAQITSLIRSASGSPSRDSAGGSAHWVSETSMDQKLLEIEQHSPQANRSSRKDQSLLQGESPRSTADGPDIVRDSILKARFSQSSEHPMHGAGDPATKPAPSHSHLNADANRVTTMRTSADVRPTPVSAGEDRVPGVMHTNLLKSGIYSDMVFESDADFEARISARAKELAEKRSEALEIVKEATPEETSRETQCHERRAKASFSSISSIEEEWRGIGARASTVKLPSLTQPDSSDTESSILDDQNKEVQYRDYDLTVSRSADVQSEAAMAAPYSGRERHRVGGNSVSEYDLEEVEELVPIEVDEAGGDSQEPVVLRYRQPIVLDRSDASRTDKVMAPSAEENSLDRRVLTAEASKRVAIETRAHAAVKQTSMSPAVRDSTQNLKPSPGRELSEAPNELIGSRHKNSSPPSVDDQSLEGSVSRDIQSSDSFDQDQPQPAALSPKMPTDGRMRRSIPTAGEDNRHEAAVAFEDGLEEAMHDFQSMSHHSAEDVLPNAAGRLQGLPDYLLRESQAESHTLAGDASASRLRRSHGAAANSSVHLSQNSTISVMSSSSRTYNGRSCREQMSEDSPGELRGNSKQVFAYSDDVETNNSQGFSLDVGASGALSVSEVEQEQLFDANNISLGNRMADTSVQSVYSIAANVPRPGRDGATDSVQGSAICDAHSVGSSLSAEAIHDAVRHVKALLESAVGHYNQLRHSMDDKEGRPVPAAQTTSPLKRGADRVPRSRADEKSLSPPARGHSYHHHYVAHASVQTADVDHEAHQDFPEASSSLHNAQDTVLTAHLRHSATQTVGSWTKPDVDIRQNLAGIPRAWEQHGAFTHAHAELQGSLQPSPHFYGMHIPPAQPGQAAEFLAGGQLHLHAVEGHHMHRPHCWHCTNHTRTHLASSPSSGLYSYSSQAHNHLWQDPFGNVMQLQPRPVSQGFYSGATNQWPISAVPVQSRPAKPDAPQRSPSNLSGPYRASSRPLTPAALALHRLASYNHLSRGFDAQTGPRSDNKNSKYYGTPPNS